MESRAGPAEPSLDLIRRVRATVEAHAIRTPLLHSTALSQRTGKDVWLKCEGFQRTGSFKFRGALAALELLAPAARAGGVVTSSAGNHGAGLARAARIFGLPCRIVVPEGTPRVKVEKMRAEGAEVLFSPFTGYDATQSWTLERVEELGGAFISPFEDPGVIAGGGGTLALEILEDLPEVDTILLPCGGGGCLSGVGLAARGHPRPVKVFGANTDASPGMWRSFRDGRAHLEVKSQPTVAEGLEGGVSETTYVLARELAEDILLVPEKDVRRAVARTLLEDKLLIEGSAAVAPAALLHHDLPGRTLCLILTGSNIDSRRLQALLAEAT